MLSISFADNCKFITLRAFIYKFLTSKFWPAQSQFGRDFFLKRIFLLSVLSNTPLCHSLENENYNIVNDKIAFVFLDCPLNVNGSFYRAFDSNIL